MELQKGIDCRLLSASKNRVEWRRGGGAGVVYKYNGAHSASSWEKINAYTLGIAMQTVSVFVRVI